MKKIVLSMVLVFGIVNASMVEMPEVVVKASGDVTVKTIEAIEANVSKVDVNSSNVQKSKFEENIITYVGKCLGCHGTKFEKKAMNMSNIVSEMDVVAIEKSLIGYQEGTYGKKMAGLMKAQVKDLSKEDIKTLSEYIASLNKK